MNKLLFIAHDSAIISKFQKYISWKEYGFYNISCAINHAQFTRELSSKLPGLIIIDSEYNNSNIINVLDLIRQVSQDIQIIIMASEKNFALAQASINYQIAALLLWDELNTDMLQKIVKRILAHLDNYIHKQGIIKRQLFRDILKGKLPTTEEIIRYFEIKDSTPYYVMFLIKRDMPSPMLSKDWSPAKDYYAVNWHGSDFPVEFDYIATVNISMDTWCSLLRLKNIRSSAKTLTLSHAAALALQNSFKQQFCDTVSIAYSHPFSNFSKLLTVVDQLDEQLELQRYFGRARICSVTNTFNTKNNCDELLQIYGERFSTCILNNDHEQAILLMQKLFHQLAFENYTYACVEKTSRMLTAILNGYCIKKRIPTLEERLVHKTLSNPFCYGIIEMINWFTLIITLLLQENGYINKATYSTKVQAIMDFIEQNYGEHIDTNTLSQHFHLSNDYLRHLFKKETGENLTTYITHVKIEKAKLLLNTGQYNVSEIAYKTGFNTSQYFGTVFRKYVGITPKEFILQCKENPWKSPI